MRRTKTALGFALLGCAATFWSACGGDDEFAFDMTPPPGDGGFVVPDGSRVLPDGAIVLPDGAVVRPDGAPVSGGDGAAHDGPAEDGTIHDAPTSEGASNDGTLNDGTINDAAKDVAIDSTVDAGTDATVTDSASNDSGSTDGGAIDTGIDDTGALDTGAIDTGIDDTGIDDTGALDTGALDTGALDTGIDDTGAIDAGAQDTGAEDAGSGVDAGPDASGSVLQHHKHASRDGLYIEPSFTKAAAAGMKIDTSFVATYTGPVLAQPLYVENGPQGKDVLLVATEQNDVFAFDAANGAVVWQTPYLGAPVPLSALMTDPGCGNIDPLGITGTPYVDIASRTIFFDAMTTPDNGTTKRHLIYGISLDDGTVRAGWPLDVQLAFAGAATKFSAKDQNQRGAIGFLDGVIYVSYSGHSGDCGNYHGWVVAVPIADPSKATAFNTKASRGGLFGTAGVSSDGTSMFATTGNTAATGGTWAYGESVIRLGKGATFSGSTNDYYTPTNWSFLDDNDLDMGGTQAIPVDLPGATPSALMVALGKDQNAYLLNRNALGGLGAEIQKFKATNDIILGAAATYATATDRYVVYRGGTCGHSMGVLAAVRVKPGAPPSLATGWCTSQQDTFASPMVTTTDGTSNAIVWATSHNAIYGLDGDTGLIVYDGVAAANGITNPHKFNTPIAAKGRIFVAGQSRLFALKP
jgi:hypothetical protein